jgi:hypothetical protein
LHELYPVLSDAQLQAADLLKIPHHQLRVFGFRVDAGSHRGAPDVHLPQPFGGFLELPAVPGHRVAVRRELLAQANRRGIL